MGACTLTLDALRKMNPCDDRFSVIAPAFKGKPMTARQAVNRGAKFSDIVWVAATCAVKDKDVERRLRMWVADCAARVLRIYEQSPGANSAPRDAIIAARDFANGEIDDAARAARDAAWDAAWDASWAARDAAGDARAAAWAARAAAGAARDDAAGDDAWAARDARAAAWAARAAAGAARDDAAGDDAWAARDARAAAGAAAWAAEEEWQLKRLVAWLSGREPKPLPLPTAGKGDL